MISDFLYNLLKILRSRVFIVSVGIIVLFSILVARIFDLQILNETYYMSTYVQKAERTVYSPGTRGRILDCNGKVLAYDTLTYVVTFEDKFDSSTDKNGKLNSIVAKAIEIIEKEGDKVIVDFPLHLKSDGKWEYANISENQRKHFLKNIFGENMTVKNISYERASADVVANYLKKDFFEIHGDYTPEMIEKMLSIRYNIYEISSNKYIKTTIAKNVSKQTMIALYESTADLTGIAVEERTVRKYNDSKYFASILGYTGTISNEELEDYKVKHPEYQASDVVGKSGIEKSMELELQGKRGEENIFVDNTGKVLKTISKSDPGIGNDVYLTLDTNLQKAAYTILEKKITSILLSEIVNMDVDENNEDDSKIHPISVTKVYSQLVNNNVVSLDKLKEKASYNENNVYDKYTNALNNAVNEMTDLLNGDGKPNVDLDREHQDYCDYVYDILKKNEILLTSIFDLQDKTYLDYVDGKISINDFIKYCIKMNWIDIEQLGSDSSYISTDEAYELIKNFCIDDFKNNSDFGKKVFYYRLYDGTINGCEVCMLLYDQGVFKPDNEKYDRLMSYDSTVAYSFIKDKIKNLEITPAQIALDPCSGSIVLTDPNTGQVKALVTYPSYDNNKLSGSVDPKYWAQLTSDLSDPLYNRATQGLVAPGSTFKMITAMAALENNVVGIDETVDDTGEFDKIKPSPKCWAYPNAHGEIDIVSAIAQSCNYFFYEMGWRLGMNNNTYDSALGLSKIEKYTTMVGLNMKSGVEIEESEPHFSTQSAVHSAIGQGSHAYSPVQLARYVSTLANGGTNNSLTLISKVTSSDGSMSTENKVNKHNDVEASAYTWDVIKEGMRKVVTEGTVRNYFHDTKIEISGKSGTAQENKRRNSHALFVAYAPSVNPEIAVSAVIPFGNSSHDAAELAKSIIQYYYKEINDKDIEKPVEEADVSNVTQD